MVGSIRNLERVAFGETILVAQANAAVAGVPSAETGAAESFPDADDQQAFDEAGTGTRIVAAIEDGAFLRLPADASVDRPRVNGTDLEFVQADGSVIVIHDGAITGLTIYIGDVEIPAQTVATLFEANGIETAAGPAGGDGTSGARGSGGNFEVPVGGIGEAFNIGDLLDPSELSFDDPEGRDLYQGEFDENDIPTIVSIALSGVLDEDGFSYANKDARRDGEVEGSNLEQQSAVVVVDFGRDVPANLLKSFEFLNPASLSGQLQALDGQDIVFVAVGRNLVGTAGVAAKELVRIELDSALLGPGSGQVTYAIKIKLLGPIKHNGNNEDVAVLSEIQFRITDSTGDGVEGRFDVTILDDIPSVELGLFADAGDNDGVKSLQLDESLLTNVGGDDLWSGRAFNQYLSLFHNNIANPGYDAETFGVPLGIAQSSVAVLTVRGYGADGAAASNALVYSLKLESVSDSEKTGPVLSGVKTTEGKPIYLFEENGFVVGRFDSEGRDGEADSSDPAAFALHIDQTSGVITMIQYVSIWHNKPGETNEAIALFAGDNPAGRLLVAVIVTDGDGDTAKDTLDIGGRIRFLDDAPVGFNVSGLLRLDDEAQDLFAPNVGPLFGAGDALIDVNSTSGLGLFGAGVDGVKDIAIGDGPEFSVIYKSETGTVGTEAISEWRKSVEASTGITTFSAVSEHYGLGSPAAVLTIHPNGAYGFTLNAPVVHLGDGENDQILRFDIVVADGDGDTASASLTLTVNDDTPEVVPGKKVTVIVDEDGLLHGNADGGRLGEEDGSGANEFTSQTGALQSLVRFGADGMGKFKINPTTSADSGLNSKGQKVLISSSGEDTLYGYVETGSGAGDQVGDHRVFTLTVSPDGSYTFTLHGQIDHPTRDGLDGDNAENLLGTKIDLSQYVQTTDGDGDHITLSDGSFTVDVLDDIPILTARDAIQSDITHTVITSYSLQAGNTAVRGMDGREGYNIRLTGVDLNDGNGSVNTTGSLIGVGDGQSVDGYEQRGNGKNKAGPEILKLEFLKNFNVGAATNDGAYGVNVVRYKIDVSEAKQNDKSIVFMAATCGGVAVDFDVTINGVTVTPLSAVYDGKSLVGYVLSVPHAAIVAATGKNGVLIDSFEIGNYNDFAFAFNSEGDEHTKTGGNSFKVGSIEAHRVVTEALEETFKVAHDETVGINNDADPYAADDVSGPADKLVIGYAQSAVSVLDSGSLFVGTVGADGAGAFSFAITDPRGNAISNEDSGLKTLSGASILISTNSRGELIGSDGGEPIFMVSVTADGYVRITQYKPIAHEIDGASEAAHDDVAKVTAALHVTATLTDFDGDSVSKTSPVALDIQFQDDGPTAYSGSVSIYEGETKTGKLRFDKGADDAMVTAIDGASLVFDEDGWSQAIVGLVGTLRVKADGYYSFVAQPKDPYVSNGMDQFQFTVTDGDGDISEAFFNVTVNDQVDAVTVKLTASKTASEDDGKIVYRVSLVDAYDQPVVANNAITVMLENGEKITIGANATSGEVTTDVNRDDVYAETDAISNKITNATEANGGEHSAFENLAYDATAVTTEILDDKDVVTATLTAGDPIYDATCVTISYTITLSSTLERFTPPDGASLTFILQDGTNIVLAAGEVSKTVDVRFQYGNALAHPITNSIAAVSGAEVYEDLKTAGKTSVIANTKPEVVDGVASLAVNEAGLDTRMDGFDLIAGTTTGTASMACSETAVELNALTFKATGEDIVSITFADAANLPPSINNLHNGTAGWVRSEDGRSLTLTIDGQAALVLVLTGAARADAGTNAVVGVTATLVGQFSHLAPTSILDVILSQVQVDARDFSGDFVSGYVTVNIVDDAPVAFAPDRLLVTNEASDDASALNLASAIGADGLGELSFNVANGEAVKDGNGAHVYFDGSKVIYNLNPDAPYVLEGRTEAGGKLAFTVTLDPANDSWSFQPRGTLYTSISQNLQFESSGKGGGGNDEVVAIDLGGAKDLLVTANGNNTVNYNANSFGVSSRNSVSGGDMLRFDFVTDATATKEYGSHYKVSSFTFTIKHQNHSPGMDIRAVNADEDQNFVGDNDDTTVSGLAIIVGRNNKDITESVVTPNSDGTYTLNGFQEGDTIKVIAGEALFNAIEITGIDNPNNNKDDTFKIAVEKWTAESAASTVEFAIGIKGKDGDGDAFASDLHVTMQPAVAQPLSFELSTASAHILGSLENDVTTAYFVNDEAQGGEANYINGGRDNDILVGGDGDDILIGGLGNDTLFGGAGNDTFAFAEIGDANVDTITDYLIGDTIDLSELLSNIDGDIDDVRFDRGDADGNVTVQVQTEEHVWEDVVIIKDSGTNLTDASVLIRWAEGEGGVAAFDI